MTLFEVGVGSFSFFNIPSLCFVRRGCLGVVVASPSLLYMLSQVLGVFVTLGCLFLVLSEVVQGLEERAQCLAHSTHISGCTPVIPCITDVPF